MSVIDGKTMLEVLRDFVQKAEQSAISYMVTGSFAMSAYGEMRFTRDIDVVIEISREQIIDFFQFFEKDYYLSVNSIKRAVENQSMFNLIHLEKAVKIDCIVRKKSEFERLKFVNRRQISVGELSFWIITKEDLIVSKLNWAKSSSSEMQLKDVANLTGDDYDSEYVETWIEKLNLEEIWQKVLEWKIQHPK
ncbi:MAG TPA: DUF6036 family nucleotidyltransferase [Pyrinomonadaceae bacterium]|nr:DUF6036 family nucleotidyltransferase [Pyrinomonadaceae bacterium]